MAGHVLRAGFDLLVHARRAAQAEALLQSGARWAETPRTLASGADVIVTMVGFPSDVETLYFGDGGLLESARPGSILVDMTTSSPALARRIGEAAAARGLLAPRVNPPAAAAGRSRNVACGKRSDSLQMITKRQSLRP